MRFPEKPATTAGLGIACALVLLVVLSWPTLAGSLNFAAVPASNTANSATAVQTQTATIAYTAAVNANSSVSSNSLYPSSAVGPVSNSSSAVAPTMTTLVSTITSVNSRTTVPANQQVYSLGASASTSTTGYGILAVLSIASLAVAVGSTLFIRRRVNPD